MTSKSYYMIGCPHCQKRNKIWESQLTHILQCNHCYFRFLIENDKHTARKLTPKEERGIFEAFKQLASAKWNILRSVSP